MKQFIIILFISAVFLQQSYSQENKISFQIGYGTYSLADIKEYQLQMAAASSRFTISTAKKFPNSLNASLSSEWYFNDNNSIGGNFAFFSTNRLNYWSDVPNESFVYNYKMKLLGGRLGLQYKHLLPRYLDIKPFVQIRSGFVGSSFTEIEFLIQNTDTLKYKDVDFSTTVFIEPTVGFSYNLNKKLSLETSLGWEFDLNSKLFTKKESYVYWGGLRFLIGLGYRF